MATIKIKFRFSSVAGKEGTLLLSSDTRAANPPDSYWVKLFLYNGTRKREHYLKALHFSMEGYQK